MYAACSITSTPSFVVYYFRFIVPALSLLWCYSYSILQSLFFIIIALSVTLYYFLSTRSIMLLSLTIEIRRVDFETLVQIFQMTLFKLSIFLESYHFYSIIPALLLPLYHSYTITSALPLLRYLSYSIFLSIFHQHCSISQSLSLSFYYSVTFALSYKFSFIEIFNFFWKARPGEPQNIKQWKVRRKVYTKN